MAPGRTEESWMGGVGGYQSVPECALAGGALIGCAAGVANMAQLRGTHLAMKTGMLAADAAYHEIARGDEGATSPLHMQAYHRSLRDSWVMRELEQVPPQVLLSFVAPPASVRAVRK